MLLRTPPYFFLFLLCQLYLPAQESLYSRSDIIADLQYLKSALEKHHPNLYTYSSKETIDNWFEEKYLQLPDSFSHTEAFKLVTSFSGVLKDGHSYIYPSAQHLQDFFNSAPLFPLDVFLSGDQLMVVRNFSDEQNIPAGSILTQINGIEVNDIMDLIVSHTCRDGDNLEYPRHLMYQFFPAYYSYFFGFKTNYRIEFTGPNLSPSTVEIKGLPRSQIKAKRSKSPEQGIHLKILDNNQSAVLSIPSFDIGNLKTDYSQNFKREIKSIFKKLQEKQIKNLAIDLKDNQGGALSNGIYLLQHFMNSPFQCVSSFYTMKNGQKKKFNAKWASYFKPFKKNHFSGKFMSLRMVVAFLVRL